MYQSLGQSQILLLGMRKLQLFLGIFEQIQQSYAKQLCGVSTKLHSELKGD